MGKILYIIARVMFYFFAPILRVYGIFRSLYIGGFKELDEWYKDQAISLDQHSNVIGKYFWNDFFGDGFGNIDETISSRLGKNQLSKTLKPFGSFINRCLGRIEEDHSIKSIEEDEL